MKDICLLFCGRWSCIISETDPGMYSPTDCSLNVRVSCDGKRFAQFGLRSAMKADYEKPRGGDAENEAFIRYANYLGISVSSGDLDNASFLLRTCDKLCFHILDGGSVKDWCEERGLTPVSEWEVPRERKRPCPLEIIDGEWHFILPRESHFEPKRTAKAARRTRKSAKCRK